MGCYIYTVLLVSMAAGALASKYMPNEVKLNCTRLHDDSFKSCYTCMGRDMENCEWGQTCCNTVCFKLVDEKHSIISKGCWAPDTDDIKQLPKEGSARTYETDVKLPWADDEVIGGMGYFCDTDFCNGALRQPLSLIAVVVSVVLSLLLTL